MKNRIGTDLVEVSRVRDAIERTGEAFLNRVYTIGEQQYCDSKGAHRFESYAARFAVKEAFAKAVGTGIGEAVSFHEVEVIHDDAGKPGILLHGGTKAYFQQYFTGAEVDVSISHTATFAVATVLISGSVPSCNS